MMPGDDGQYWPTSIRAWASVSASCRTSPRRSPRPSTWPRSISGAGRRRALGISPGTIGAGAGRIHACSSEQPLDSGAQTRQSDGLRL